MKISCQSCQAKYTIADDKVLGKIVKIRCKKCGDTIVVNGGGGTGEAVSTSVFPEAPAPQGGPEPWTVNVGDGDQRTMTDPEIVAAYQAGVVTDDTYCWRDGMGDWLPLREVDALAEACGATRAMASPAELQMPPAVGSGGNGAASRAAPAAAAATARRAGGRAPGGDLFGGVAQAGSEEDVMTSAPAGMPQARAAEPEKLVGERNENSVLFSLSALTSKGPGGPKPVPGAEASGLIDIKQLSAQLHSASDKKRSGIDDIMNLAGGGAFSPSLTAPTLLSAPAVSEYSAEGGAATAAPAPSKNRGLIFMALGGGALFIAAAIGATFMLMRPKAETADKAAGSASAGETAPPAASAAATGASAAPAVASATGSAAAAPAPTETAAPKTAETKTPSATPKAAAAGAATPAPAAAGPAKESSLAAAMAGAAATPPPAAAAPAAQGGGGDQPFNMGEAKARLAAAASAAQGCKKPDGPSGSGRVVVMFAPSGAAQSATVSGPPFEGTPTGACVAARFRGVKVPAFTGSPFSVSKSFSIN